MSLDAAVTGRIDALEHGRRKSALGELQDVVARLSDGAADEATRASVGEAFATVVDAATADNVDTATLHAAGERLIDLAKPVGHLATPVAKAVGDVLTASGSIL